LKNIGIGIRYSDNFVKKPNQYYFLMSNINNFQNYQIKGFML